MSLTIVEIKNIQTALAALNGGVPDGIIGHKTTQAIFKFQEFVSKTKLTGKITDIVDDLDSIWTNTQLNEDHLKCQCNQCNGYGHGRGVDAYRNGKPQIEAYYEYEYPGISRITLWGAKFIQVMYPEYEWTVTSGYRCDIDNENHGRRSTNHHGKALDQQPKISNTQDLIEACDQIRRELNYRGLMNIGWDVINVISLEPSNIAPTWIHLDCRNFERKYIEETITKLINE